MLSLSLTCRSKCSKGKYEQEDANETLTGRVISKERLSIESQENNDSRISSSTSPSHCFWGLFFLFFFFFSQMELYILGGLRASEMLIIHALLKANPNRNYIHCIKNKEMSVRIFIFS